MIITYNIRIQHSSDQALADFVKDGDLVPSPAEKIQGAYGAVYRPSPRLQPHDISAESDTEFRLGSATVEANCYALPPEEYAGLVTQSPGFRQYLGLRSLVRPLTEHLDAQQLAEWRQELYTAVAAGSRPMDGLPVLTPLPCLQPARWLSEQTRFVRGRSGWLLVLAFEVTLPENRSIFQRSAVGIDVGLKRLAVAAFKDGSVAQIGGIPDVHFDQAELELFFPNEPHKHELVRQLNIITQHAAARTELARLTGHLLQAASFVAFEDIEFGEDCDQHFITRCRDLGLRDYLEVWLPKRLRQADIYGMRVPPEMTSRTCNLTHLHGTRGKRNFTRFVNGNGDLRDADVNAAANIRDAGLAISMWGKAR